MLEYLAKNKDVLSMVGSCIVVTVGAAWALFVYKNPPGTGVNNSGTQNLNAQQESTNPSERPIAAPALIDLPSHVVVSGRNTWAEYPKDQRAFYLFGLGFIIFWCTTLLIGVGSIIGKITDFDLASLVVAPWFILVPLYMLYMGLSLFASQLAEIRARVSAIVTRDVIVITTEITGFFSQSLVGTSTEWGFDGTSLVMKKDGTRFSLPRMPKYVREQVTGFLGEHWKQP